MSMFNAYVGLSRYLKYQMHDYAGLCRYISGRIIDTISIINYLHVGDPVGMLLYGVTINVPARMCLSTNELGSLMIDTVCTKLLNGNLVFGSQSWLVLFEQETHVHSCHWYYFLVFGKRIGPKLVLSRFFLIPSDHMEHHGIMF